MTTEQKIDFLFEEIKSLTSKQEQKEKWLDNQELMQTLKISKRTAQHYRDSGIISFSQVGNKIYYRLSDVEALLNNHYKGADKDDKVYSEKQLVSFGNYLLSKKRDEFFKRNPKLGREDFLREMKGVHHSDIENFKSLITQK